MKTRLLWPILLIIPLAFALSSCSDDEPVSEPKSAEAPPEQPKGDKGKSKGGGGLADQLIAEYDADVDDAISDFEVSEQTWRFIERADEDGDSRVTREEFANLRPPRGDGGEGGKGGDGKGRGGDGKGKGGFGGKGRPDPAAMFAQMDQNGDGLISADEAPEFIWERMSAADANGDGGVSVEEMQARRAAREAERAAGGEGAGRGGKEGKGGGDGR
ncbi:MAG: hypothetical protein ACI8UO_002370 [Verrucomicrobiales bacterium]|jgi:hypothetical protein